MLEKIRNEYIRTFSGKLFREEVIKGGKIALKFTEKIEAFKELNAVEKYIALIEISWVDCDIEKLRYQTYDYMNIYSIMRIAL